MVATLLEQYGAQQVCNAFADQAKTTGDSDAAEVFADAAESFEPDDEEEEEEDVLDDDEGEEEEVE